MIGTIASKKSCNGGNGGANTGRLGCLSLFGTPTHLLALRKGFEIDSVANWDLDYLTPLVQKGDLIPLIDASSFEDLSSEDGYSTNAKGVKRLNVKGLPEYKLMFEEGHEFYREMSKLESFKRFDFMIGDAEGNWILASKSNGNFQGMTAGHVTPELTKRKVEGGDPESKSLVVQFLDRLQWDTNYGILHAEDIDVTPQEMPVINGVELSFNVIPANTDTVLNVKVVLASDRNTLVEGLSASDFVVTKGITTPGITLVDEVTPGIYNITIDSAVVTGDSLKIESFSGATNTTVALSNGILYRNVLENSLVAA